MFNAVRPDKPEWIPMATHTIEAKMFMAKPDFLWELNCQTPASVNANADQSVILQKLRSICINQPSIFLK